MCTNLVFGPGFDWAVLKGAPCTLAQPSKLGLWLLGPVCSDPTSHVSWGRAGCSGKSARVQCYLELLGLARLAPGLSAQALPSEGLQAFLTAAEAEASSVQLAAGRPALRLAVEAGFQSSLCAVGL